MKSCFSFLIVRKFDVGILQSVPVIVYDYYEPGKIFFLCAIHIVITCLAIIAEKMWVAYIYMKMQIHELMSILSTVKANAI